MKVPAYLREVCNADDPVPIGMHTHLCKGCGTIWRHSRQEVLTFAEAHGGEAGYNATHDCPTCGKNERVKLKSMAPEDTERDPIRELMAFLETLEAR